MGALGVLHGHVGDRDGVRQRDGQRPLGPDKRPAFTGVPEGTLGGERGWGGQEGTSDTNEWRPGGPGEGAYLDDGAWTSGQVEEGDSKDGETRRRRRVRL